ncbi:DUF2157 domain-containing protein [Endozoicomonas sp. SM1973]|uniref:DUF2157 domain-containing protein n=1 Tax=Spartinivicinus marinus TaxID=2994442 RepID=A0A853I840_9GAMM|nr:DUF2157 domain-containing protein [Spartinivicinus marinus]MCX4026446.1 DUF2157 domain-containing protein [Spartinivicinus marinus]NYZ66818.1 DUF2157 domain-containing protein [Spartinivicinus marinus]
MEKEELIARTDLATIPANRRLVDELYAHGYLTAEGKAYALNLLHPHNQWGLWVSRLLLILGTALVLAGVIYFFAFNWARLTPIIKFTTIQTGLVGCLIAAYSYSLQKLVGKIFLLAASVLVGVFLAVFGQVYQTGADAYQLFMGWALLTLGWTIIANFSVQWLLWLIICNIFVLLWWEQSALPSRSMEDLLYSLLLGINGLALALREYAAQHNYNWLSAQWLRAILVIALSIFLAIPIEYCIIDPGSAHVSTYISALFGGVALVGGFWVYRFILFDMWALATIVLTCCVVATTATFKIFFELIGKYESVTFLLMGLATLGVFTIALIYLRAVVHKMEATRD